MLPASSVTIQVTVVIPIGKLTGALLVIEAMVPLSVAVAIPIDNPFAIFKPASVDEMTLAGQVITGA